MTRLRFYPVYLLTALVILPMLAMTVAGLHLLKNERKRLEQQANKVNERILENNAQHLIHGISRIRDDLLTDLLEIPHENRDEALRGFAAHNPLVRNVFRVSEDGIRKLPSLGIHLDPETSRFVQRYAALFEGRMNWFPAEADPVSRDYFTNRPSWFQSKIDTPKATYQWRPWHWEDQDGLLLYILDEATGDILGVELEMMAFYARLDVLLREITHKNEALVLLDRRDRVLIASSEVPEFPPRMQLEMGSALPFARLGKFGPARHSTDFGKGFYMVAIGAGLLLVLSMVAGTLGLTAWVHRSRREAMRKTTFVSNVSHEFKTPLTTLRLYSELLLEGRITDPEKQKSYLRTMCNESERLARLVHNALDFSRLEMGRNRLNPAEIDLTDGIHRVAERLRERFDAVEMEVLLPEDPCRVWADPDAVEQILLNLMDNAIKYAAEGKRLEVQQERIHKKVEVRVMDRGTGIPSRERKKIFEAFHQVDDRLTRESGGTGLGLHISRRLARQMHGDLDLRAASNGACFVWTLPGDES